jgi:hypothetical protein
MQRDLLIPCLYSFPRNIITIPTDLLELKPASTWRATRKYVREPIPDELRHAAAEMSRRYPPSLVGRILKLDHSRFSSAAAIFPIIGYASVAKDKPD